MSVTFPRGFRASGVAAGIKPSGALDLSAVIAEEPVPAAAVFTQNGAAAAPVRLSRRHVEISGGAIRGVTLNSGCANAATGELGDRAAYDMAAAVAGEVGCEVTEVLVCSTGPIGPQLPMDKILPAMQLLVARAASSPSAGREAAAGLMTTDTFIKEAAFSGSGGFRVGWDGKGGGDDPPQHGHHAGGDHHRRRFFGPAATGGAGRGGGRDLQQHQYRRMRVHQRHGDTHGFRPFGD